MHFDLPTLLWIHTNCVQKKCKYNIPDNTPIHLACTIQFQVMVSGIKNQPEVCTKYEESK